MNPSAPLDPPPLVPLQGPGGGGRHRRHPLWGPFSDPFGDPFLTSSAPLRPLPWTPCRALAAVGATRSAPFGALWRELRSRPHLETLSPATLNMAHQVGLRTHDAYHEESSVAVISGRIRLARGEIRISLSSERKYRSSVEDAQNPTKRVDNQKHLQRVLCST